MEQPLLNPSKEQNNGSLVLIQPNPFEQPPIIPINETVSNPNPFIQANTIECSLSEIKHKHIIPVFIKDNEPLISHADFIETMLETTAAIYAGETILKPNIRLSHEIRGRIPSAKDKPAKDLSEHEKTLYYERMAFVIDIPSVTANVDGNNLCLTVGGVKSFNQDNLYSKKGTDEHFKIFVGFKNTVCTNLCIWTDGYDNDVRVSSVGELKSVIRIMLENYNSNYQLFHLEDLSHYSLTEQQFAQLAGRVRMYHHLPNNMKQDIPEMLLTDTQLGMVVRDYYKDNSFCRDEKGNINLWRLYNLFTGANKSSYIDNFLERNVNAFHFISQIRYSLQQQTDNWYLN